MCRLFADWSYLRAMLLTALGVHLACWAMRRLRVPAWLAIPIGLVLIIELLALFYYRSTTSFGLASGRTIDLMTAEIRLIWQQFPTAVAPVPGVGSFAAGGAAVIALCALLADTFAFRAYGRGEAAVPAAIVFIFTSALGTERNRITVAALWIAVALITVAVLRVCHAREEVAWLGRRRRSLRSMLPSTLAGAVIVGVGAAVVAPILPGAGEPALIDTHNGSDEVTQVISPLVDIRSRLVNRANVLLFTAEATRPSYWKIASLMDFDGTVWTPADDDLLDADNSLLTTPLTNVMLEQKFTIRRLGGNLVPSAAPLVQANTPGLLYSPISESLVVQDKLTSGQQIEVVSAPIDPSPAQLATASTAGAPAGSYDLPRGIPSEAFELAAEVTAAATNPYEQVILLQNWFKTQFKYDLKVQKGHSDDAIRNFLSIRRGYCEQFAGTFAVMARTLGLPARVAVGFTNGELKNDGLYHVLGRHAHAWTEVWFEGFGWVLFDPTPGRGAPGAEAHTGWQADQAGPSNERGENDEETTPSSTPRTTIDDGDQVPTTGRNSTATSAVTPVARSSSSGGSTSSTPALVLLAIVAAVIAWLAGMPAVMLWWRRRARGDAADRIAAAWRGMCRSASRAGVPLARGATPYEVAHEVQAHGKVDYRMVREAAKIVTTATYGAAGPTPDAAARVESLDRDLAKSCLAEQPWHVRLLAKLDPRQVKAG
jgi:transglutaminase-like putative cysteine protease